MKKNLVLLFALICSMNLFTACEKEEEPVKEQPIQVDGTYVGTLNVLGTDIPQKIYLTKVSENQMKLELKDFTFNNLQLGTIAIDACTLTKEGAKVTLKGAQKITLAIGACDVEANGTIEAGKLTANINVKTALPNMGIIPVTFVGQK